MLKRKEGEELEFRNQRFLFKGGGPSGAEPGSKDLQIELATETFLEVVAAFFELSRAIRRVISLARIMHEPPAATADMAVLPGVLGSRTLGRTEKYGSGSSPCGCPVARPSPRSRDGVSSIMRAS